jgi:hypothetical protein
MMSAMGSRANLPIGNMIRKHTSEKAYGNRTAAQPSARVRPVAQRILSFKKMQYTLTWAKTTLKSLLPRINVQHGNAKVAAFVQPLVSEHR